MKRNIVFVAMCVALFAEMLSANEKPLNVPSGKPPTAEITIDSSQTFYEAISHVDLIVLATIDEISAHVTDDIFAEAYTVLSLSGVVATPDGPKEIPRKYRLRTSVSWADKALINSEYIFFIINNRKRYDPIVRLLPVRSGIVHHHVQSLKKK